MTEKSHPDFLTAPAENRWIKTLPELRSHLRGEAWRLQGAEAWFILPRGATVGMRVNPENFHKELRITRRLRKPLNDKGRAAWAFEIGVFLAQLDCEGWTCVQNATEEGGAVGVEGPGQKLVAVYVETVALGAKEKEKLTCHRCGNPFEPHPSDKLYRNPTCTPCAMALGTEETAALAKARADAQSSSPSTETA